MSKNDEVKNKTCVTCKKQSGTFSFFFKEYENHFMLENSIMKLVVSKY